jgi:hypothetical protein
MCRTTKEPGIRAGTVSARSPALTVTAVAMESAIRRPRGRAPAGRDHNLIHHSDHADVVEHQVPGYPSRALLAPMLNCYLVKCSISAARPESYLSLIEAPI